MSISGFLLLLSVLKYLYNMWNGIKLHEGRLWWIEAIYYKSQRTTKNKTNQIDTANRYNKGDKLESWKYSVQKKAEMVGKGKNEHREERI